MNALAEFRPKLIYLARRNPALSREAFVKRWRQHGALGMSLPRWRNIAQYVHCDVLHPQAQAAEVDTEYDGIGLIWHRSPEARAAHIADTSSRQTMERDEEETFAEPIVTSCLLARERVLKQPNRAERSLVKLTCFIRAHAFAENLVRERVGASRRVVESMSALGLLPRGHVVNAPLPATSGDGWGLRADCVEEWWFDDEDSALRAVPILRSSTYPAATRLVLTNEVLLYAA